MQLYALDERQRLIFARHAAKQKDYFCLECRRLVRRRGGSHRHVHFYHLVASHACRQNGKSMAHLQVQSRLLSLLPPGECLLECRFPEINRIADAVWISKKIVFEVQCSSISAEEVSKRNHDYRSLGFQVVWILHDKRYNQQRMSSAEIFLQECPHYFTNIDAEGAGDIYDQFSIVQKGVRTNVLPPLLVGVDKLIENNRGKTKVTNLVSYRMERWPIYFGGDLIDVSIAEEQPKEIVDYLMQAMEAEQFAESLRAKPLRWWQKVQRLYWLCFQAILERACK